VPHAPYLRLGFLNLPLQFPFPDPKFQMALLTRPAAFEFLFVGVTACFARPCNARENVAYLPPCNAIRRPLRFLEAAPAFMRGRSTSVLRKNVDVKDAL
jgi:hypothetical protein